MTGDAKPDTDHPSCDDKDRLIEELREAVRARQELLDIAAHELRNPMASLLLQVEHALLLVSPQDVQLHHRLQRLQRLIGRTIVRATALLDASRLNAGTYNPSPEPMDAAEIVRGAVEAYAAQAEHAGVTLRATAPDTLDMISDRMAFEQIVDNLLSNAIKFGAGAPVEIGLARAGGKVRLAVRDNGVGIPPEDQARIFERFERVITSRPRAGFGLGLWITRRLIEALGGTIVITSTPGQGATFEVMLPPSSPSPHEQS